MTITKEGVLYKLLYGPEWFRDWAGSDFDFFDAPEKTNICCLFWRMILSIFLIYPLVAVIGSAVCAVFIIVLSLAWLVNLLFCRWTYFYFDDGILFRFKEVRNWPLKFRGHKIYPISIIGIVLLGCGFIVSLVYWWKAWLVSLVSLGFLALLIYFLLSQSAKIKNSEFWRLTKAYFRAKKEKVCPIVTFE